MITSIDATIYGFSSGNIFKVDTVATRLVALSTITAALGLVLVYCLHLRYQNIDAARFGVRASCP